MRFFVFLSIALLSVQVHASQIKAGIFPGLNYNGELTGVFRLDTVFLLGGESFLIGPFGGVHTQSPQVTDTIYGAAIHVGKDYYFEIQGGILNRTFTQRGSQTLNGSGYAGNLVFGIILSPALGIDVVASAKRISEGTLDKRWIYQVLPMFTLRGDF